MCSVKKDYYKINEKNKSTTFVFMLVIFQIKDENYIDVIPILNNILDYNLNVSVNQI